MRKIFIALVCFFLTTENVNAGKDKEDYAVSKIPETLIKNSNVVKRLEEEVFELKNSGEAYYTQRIVLTILNENGSNHAHFSQHYHKKFFIIKSIEGTLYDANGKQIRKLKNSDIQDISGTEESLIEENRFKAHSFYHRTYPYTVEYTFEMKYNGTMFFPQWMPQSAENLSVESSTFTLICPIDYKVRFRPFNYKGAPVVEDLNGDRKYTWSVSNMEAIKLEPLAPDFRTITTTVMFGPAEFEMQDYKGNMQSWQDFGRFIHALKEGRDELPATLKQKVKDLTVGLADPKEKIRVLYEYMQKNTRYVSIQLGIGGWQPFEAEFVAEKGYGDCKALTNYMYALLKEVGIKSHYAVIRANERGADIIPDFPSSQFNHVILCVPLANDSMWLECTNQTMSAGYLGDFTCNRSALLIDEKGGTLVRTPKYGIEDNLQIRSIQGKVHEDGTLTVNSKTSYTGLQQEPLHELVHYLSKDRVKEYLDEVLDLPTYNVDQFDYKEVRRQVPIVNEQLQITANNYATITGKRLFVVPNVLTRTYRKLKTDQPRKYDIVLGFEYRDIDTVTIEIPAGFEPESLPQDVKIESKFGKYTCSIRVDGNKITYLRRIDHYSGTFPAKDYLDLAAFYDAMYKADRNKIVFVKKQ